MRMKREGRSGVYYVLKSMEQGPSFRIVKPKFPVADPAWRIIAPQRSRYTHLYFYIIDEQIGAAGAAQEAVFSVQGGLSRPET